MKHFSFNYMNIVLLLISSFFLASCDRPAKKLNNFKPEIINFVFTQGGELRAKNIKYKEENNSLSKRTKNTITSNKGQESYEVIYSFLKKYNKNYNFFDKIDIPYNHVIVGYISFKDRENNIQSISIGNSWLAYYVHIDSLGETSNILYKSSEKAIDQLLIKLGSYAKD